MSKASTTVVRIPPHVHFTVTDGTAVLMDLQSGDYLGLDPVGTRVWRILSEHGRVGEAVEEILREYPVERERVEADVDRFLEECERCGILTVERT